MAQKVVAARDFDLYLTLDKIGVQMKIETGVDFGSDITGNTEDIGAFSTDDPIATDNGGNTYDLSFSLQQAEAQDILDALAAATSGEEDGPYTHIRQIVEGATITAVWNKRRNVPATATVETYVGCTGISENDAVSRRSSETLKTWRFRAKGKTRVTIPLA